MQALIKAIQDYFESCPLLDNGKVNIDYLPKAKSAFAIVPTAGSKVIKRYVTSGGVYAFPFVFVLSDWLDADDRQAIENSDFMLELSEWVESNNKSRILPQAQGYTPQKIDVKSSAYVQAQNSNGLAQYQIQMQLNYIKE